MVSISAEQPTVGLRRATPLIAGYVAVVVATLVALAVLSGTDPSQATGDAWVHAVIIGVFAVLLPLRLRAARRGRPRAAGAVLVIAAVLVVVNLVEALIPALFPTWMRIEMVGIAALMAAVVLILLPGRR
jgi:hypothetical protein